MTQKKDYNYDLGVNSDSRYSNTGIIDNRFRSFYRFKNYEVSEVDKLMQTKFIIDDEYAYRLDKISNLFFETTKLGYVIMIYNKMYNIDDYKKGTIIYKPTDVVVSEICGS